MRFWKRQRDIYYEEEYTGKRQYRRNKEVKRKYRQKVLKRTRRTRYLLPYICCDYYLLRNILKISDLGQNH